MKILIVDDHVEILSGIESRVKKVFPDALCYKTTNTKDALFFARKHIIDLLLCDLQFSQDAENDGWKLLAKIHVISPDTKAIAYTGHGSYNVMKESLESGFHSFLEKGCALDVFKETLINVIDDGQFDSQSITNLKQKRFQIVQHKFKDSIDLLSQLSERELDVAILLAETLNLTLIAESLSSESGPVKPSSVDTYIKRIMLKLSIENRRDLAMICTEFKDQLEKLRKK